MCEKFGYEEYDFPILEPYEIFATKTGEEIVNDQLFSFEDKGGRKLAVRPEITPGTVRMIAQKYKQIPQPIRWFMIGNNWRFEKPQTGRGREFNQLEVNMFGNSSILADFEIFSLIISMMNAFGATKSMFELKYSDRRLINALLSDTLKLDANLQISTRRLMDKRLKMEKIDFLGALKDLGLNDDQSQKVEDFMSSNMQNMKNVIPLGILTENQGYKDVIKLAELLKQYDLDEYCSFSPSIIRGFDYSDGLVYEVFDKNPLNRRSMFGGERFDKLINIFGDYTLPATGFAMGDVTLLEFLKNWNLLPVIPYPTQYFVTLFKNENKYLKASLKIAEKIREAGKNCLVWLESDTKMEKQLKYADVKQIPFVLIIGDNELTTNSVTIKNMLTTEQKTESLESFLSGIQ